MTAASSRLMEPEELAKKVSIANGDVRTIHSGIPWSQFKLIQEGFKGSPGVRLFYYNETVEILMPGRAHELFKSLIGFLIETFLYSQRINFEPTGSMTRESEGVASAEPDESYEIQGLKLSIEVNFTSGNVSKLLRYQALGIDEVWIWEDSVLDVYQLREDGYQKTDHSSIPAFAPLDMALLSKCILIGETSRIEAADKLLGVD